MFRNRVYYRIKPLVPRAVRLSVRRWFAVRKRARIGGRWPIMPGSERAPAGWPGWPDGKRFALVLTHDVEGQAGLNQCRQLLELEMKLGFRSSFNFIPEGEYTVPRELRHELAENGFEVGVHDLEHDGKLYGGKKIATRSLRAIRSAPRRPRRATSSFPIPCRRIPPSSCSWASAPRSFGSKNWTGWRATPAWR